MSRPLLAMTALVLVLTAACAGAHALPDALPDQTASTPAPGLDPQLRQALDRATDDARHDGVRIRVNSGWRSAAEQKRLFRAAVKRYGSEAEAARWVARPGTSPHEAGIAVDIGPAKATAWLARHGAAYGLCRIYRNEPWHFELRPTAAARGCPTPYADPTKDPRLGR